MDTPRKRKRRSRGTLIPWKNEKTGKYEIRFSIRGVRHYRQFGENDKEAQTAAREFYNSFSSSKIEANVKPSLSTCFGIYIEMKQNKISEKSIATVKSYLENKFKPHFTDKPIEDITMLEIERYKNLRLAEKAENGTINRELCVLISVINKCSQLDIIKINPLAGKKVEKLKANQRMEYFEVNEFKRFIEELSKMDTYARMSVPVFQTLLMTCSRLSEILELKRTAANFKTNEISIYQGKTKTTKRQDMLPELSKLLQSLSTNSGYMFTRKDGKPFGDQQIHRIFARGLKAAGITKPLTPHSIRHTACSWLAMAGVPIQKIQAIAGHKNIQSTMVYSHLAPSSLSTALSLLSCDAFPVIDPANQRGLTIVK